ncbi:MAG: hypothetical protein RL346_1685, partial [Verrucomicrobiota bacterium]
MSGNATDATSAAGTRTREIDVGVIGFHTPERPAACLRLIIKEREVQIPMKNISTRQKNVVLQIQRGLDLDRQRAVSAG